MRTNSLDDSIKEDSYNTNVDKFVIEFEVYDTIFLVFGFKPEQIGEALDHYGFSQWNYYQNKDLI